VRELLAAIRLKEIIGKCGFFLVGVLFARPSISIENVIVGLEFFGLCLLNGIAIYLINAGFGYKQDRLNERLKGVKYFKAASILTMGFIILFVGLFLLFLFSNKLLLPAFIVYLIWILYSLPGGLKGIPAMGLLSAFFAQVLHFHVGYLVFADWSAQSLLLSIYFAFLFAAGHALHEVIDHDADLKAHVNTSAVYFGNGKLLNIANVLFAISAFYLFALVLLRSTEWMISVPYFIAFIIQQWFYFKLPAEKGSNELFVYRRKYMTAYLLATVAVMLIMYL
jgi:4-hydroxybenzoate polyprenyltransferase